MVITNKEIKPIIAFISKKYNIPISNLKLDIENIINSSEIDKDYNLTKCNAYIMLNGNKTQCSRSKKENCGDFCLTHHRHYTNNELKYGKIDLTKIKKNGLKKSKAEKNDKGSKVNSGNNLNDKPKKQINVEYLTLNNIDYLYNPITKYVYDFETHKKLGKLDNDLNIIQKHIKV